MFFKVNAHLNLSVFPTHHNNIIIECWDKDIIADDKLGETIPDNNGHFSLLLALSDSGEAYPELYFKVIADGKIIFTSKIYETKGLLEKNEVTGFIEQTTIDLQCIN